MRKACTLSCEGGGTCSGSEVVGNAGGNADACDGKKTAVEEARGAADSAWAVDAADVCRKDAVAVLGVAAFRAVVEAIVCSRCTPKMSRWRMSGTADCTMGWAMRTVDSAGGVLVIDTAIGDPPPLPPLAARDSASDKFDRALGTACCPGVVGGEGDAEVLLALR